jgi:hypothetical protein
MYSIVPSLFDALNAGKAQPQLTNNTFLSAGKSILSDKLVFTPENVIHPFTVSIDIKTNSNGTIVSFKHGTATGIVRIEPATGYLTYISPVGTSVTGTTVVNDGQWHKITLTHYYAWGKTILYSDNTEIGRMTEKLTPTDFYLNDNNAPATINYRNWMFYRSGMNADEIVAMNSGKMLKSSLELYAPLDEQGIISTDTLVNLAQSMGVIQRIKILSGTNSNIQNTDLRVFPNPVSDKLTISGLQNEDRYCGTVYGVDGKIALDNLSLSNNELNVSELDPSFYILSLKNDKTHESIKLSFIKR